MMPILLPWQMKLAALSIGISLFPAASSAAAQPAQSGAVQPSPAPAAADDPLHRETPRGAFMGFVEASQRGNRVVAADYLQWPRQKMSIEKEEAADQLRFILNHGF